MESAIVTMFVCTMKHYISYFGGNNLYTMLLRCICLHQNSYQAHGTNQPMNSFHQCTTNSKSLWLNERILNHTNHQPTYFASIHQGKENISQVSGMVQLILEMSFFRLMSSLLPSSSSNTWAYYRNSPSKQISVYIHIRNL